MASPDPDHHHHRSPLLISRSASPSMLRPLFLSLGCLCLLILWLLYPVIPDLIPMVPSEPAKGKEENLLASAFGPLLWPKLSVLNCAGMVNGSVVNGWWKKRRIMQEDPKELDTSCGAIRKRWHFRTEAGSEREVQFPLAFCRIVYRDYLMLEQMLSVEYSPQNLYCYSLDAKAPAVFKRRVHALAACLPHVMVARSEWRVQSNGKNVSRAHLECMRELLQANTTRPWRYALLLQNHDIPLRTNAELVEIMRVYNGTNDVATRPVMAISLNRSLDWSVRSLHLYRKGHRVPANLGRLHHTKSLNLVALSRAAVEFVLRDLNLDTLIERLERSKYGMDELLFSTLNSNLPDFPGGFTTRCLEKQKRPVQSMGRYTIWHGGSGVAKGSGGCRSGRFRHGVCVYGAEDLGHIGRDRLHFYLNKMLPSFDFGAVFCWLRTLEDRRNAGKVRVNRRFYAQLAHVRTVRYNRLRHEGRLADFVC